MVETIPRSKKKAHAQIVVLSIVPFIISLYSPHYIHHYSERTSGGEIAVNQTLGIHLESVNNNLGDYIKILTYFIIVLCIFSVALTYWANSFADLKVYKIVNSTIYVIGSSINALILYGRRYVSNEYRERPSQQLIVGRTGNNYLTLGYTFWWIILGMIMIGIARMYLRPKPLEYIKSDQEVLYPLFSIVKRNQPKIEKLLFVILIVLFAIFLVPFILDLLALVFIFLLLGLIIITIIKNVLFPIKPKESEMVSGEILYDDFAV
jgi:hypothetical protein